MDRHRSWLQDTVISVHGYANTTHTKHPQQIIHGFIPQGILVHFLNDLPAWFYIVLHASIHQSQPKCHLWRSEHHIQCHDLSDHSMHCITSPSPHC